MAPAWVRIRPRVSCESSEPSRIVLVGFSVEVKTLPARKRKCRPSGRKYGQRCEISFFDTSSVVTGTDTPPEAETRWMGELTLGAKRMVPSRFQVPPRPSAASQSVRAGPPEGSMILSLPPAKNPTNRPSGDQKGYLAPLVPARGCARSESIGRIHRTVFLSGVEAT